MNTYMQNFINYKDLLIELIKKDIKLKYRNSFLGILWSMINPLLLMIVLTIVFSAIFKNNIANFPVYVLTGRLIYGFFSEATSFAMDSIHANGQLIKKVYVPKYFFPLARLCSSFITNVLSLVPLAIVMIVTGMNFSWTNLMIVFPFAYVFLISLGVGLLLATITVFFRDIKHLYSVVLMILMYMTPIFYPKEIIPDKYSMLIEINPLFEVVEMFRNVMMYGTVPSMTSHLVCLAHASVYLLIGFFFFYKKQNRFIFHI
nr:ABC transporter permease [Aneurinibacillus sp. XH2]